MRVGLTFNLKLGETENSPDPSGTGSSDFQAEYDVGETIETASGVFDLTRKLKLCILSTLAGGFPAPCCESRLPYIHEYLNIPYAGSDSLTRQFPVQVPILSFLSRCTCVGGTGRISWSAGDVRSAAGSQGYSGYSLN